MSTPDPETDPSAVGLVAGPDTATILDAQGRVVWDFAAFGFLDPVVPGTVHPQLWDQAARVARAGLFHVVDGVYQVRGYDLSNVTFVEGDIGVVVIDPLVTMETAGAALALYRKHRGDRPVTALVYTHSHIDHFGGAAAVLDDRTSLIPVVAPEGFTEHAVSENVLLGNAMSRRATYMYGSTLASGPRGQMTSGLGIRAAQGRVSLVEPTVLISTTGQELVLDGVRFVFQLVPDTEAPSEFNIHLPELRALCVAETATHTLHNIVTLRGAPVRDARAWSRHLNETMALFGSDTDVLLAGHHWPTWGAVAVEAHLAAHRDAYCYLHDQTIRLVNQGLTGVEVAEVLRLPDALAAIASLGEYYGSVSHNVKGIYQRYLGWYDGNPSNLWAHPPVAAARRHLDYMGGADAIVARARDSAAEGDHRWVAEVLKHVMYAEPGHQQARALLADTYEILGFGAVNATWRSIYLTGARELREGIAVLEPMAPDRSFVEALPIEQMMDALAVRLDGPRAATTRSSIRWRISDPADDYLVALRNGVLIHAHAIPDVTTVDLTLSMARSTLVSLMADPAGAAALFGAGLIRHEGDLTVLLDLIGLLDQTRPAFDIVTR